VAAEFDIMHGYLPVPDSPQRHAMGRFPARGG
jgi:hypothetical protein